MKRLARVIALTGAVLALTAPEAPAAATRAEYAGQVNPICAAGNVRAEQIFADAQRRLDRLDKKDGDGSGFSRIFSAINRKLLAAQVATQAEIDLVAAAPGDEAIVAVWGDVRRQAIALTRAANRIDVKISKIFDRRRFDPRMFKRMAALERKYNKLAARIGGLYETDVELATSLGVAYCVTGATGLSFAASRG